VDSNANTICLVMIVKNEAGVIRRCLDSVRGLINHRVICDTGSTDRTQEVIHQALTGIPGSLHQVPWVDFGHNRTEALQLARGKADYHLLLDADMTVNVSDDFRNRLTEDTYLVRYEDALEWWVERLVSDRHEWEFVGAAHEYIRSRTARTRAKLSGLSVTHHADGGCQSGKIDRYLALLNRALEKDPDNPRSVFYIAQSWRDLGNLPRAIEWYEKRATMGGWEEEVWYSLFQVAHLQHRLGWAWPLVLNAYLAAYQYRPTRLEPSYQITRFYCENGQYDLAYLFGRPVAGAQYPDDILFIERGIYEHGFPLEYALACAGSGRRDEAVKVLDGILAASSVPETVKQAARERRARILGGKPQAAA